MAERRSHKVRTVHPLQMAGANPSAHDLPLTTSITFLDPRHGPQATIQQPGGLLAPEQAMSAKRYLSLPHVVRDTRQLGAEPDVLKTARQRRNVQA